MNEIVFDTPTGTVVLGGAARPFGFGRAGAVPAAAGREGDAATPLGTYALRFGLYRADRLARPRSALTLHALREDDGWCDDPDHAAYNRWVRLPFAPSHERLWREDGAYDVVLVMGHNDDPPEAGMGSAVFIHIRRPDHRPTLGCLALAPADMLALLEGAQCGTAITIR